jgi:hypothetical protein
MRLTSPMCGWMSSAYGHIKVKDLADEDDLILGFEEVCEMGMADTS